ncbi:unnamed protein product [Adineta steineri]|uniref:Uncharacterized protein n=1 Tax=Adineta steineri TaxID=433720 RepID=A0A815HX00_9BILA|nr:unnamed protein product [Adineta steineri]CAF1365541.1 unnamed protein product [Adineta steineri]
MIRVGLVTGAARGIGRAIALRLAKDGFNVAVNDIEASSGDLQKVQQEIEQLGQRSIAIIADVSDSKSVENMMQETVEKLGSLDVLIANAGIGEVKSLLDTTVEDWDKVFAVNTRGIFLCYKEAAKIMIKQAQTAALEWAPYNITVNAYCPGLIKTSLSDKSNEVLSKIQGKSVNDIESDSLKTIPIGRVGYPEDVANLVSFLAGKDSDYITGQSILVNGGRELS